MQNIFDILNWLSEHTSVMFFLAVFSILATMAQGTRRAAFLEDRVKLLDESLAQANALCLDLTREIGELKSMVGEDKACPKLTTT